MCFQSVMYISVTPTVDSSVNGDCVCCIPAANGLV